MTAPDKAMPDALSRPALLFALTTVPFGLGYFISYLFRTVNAVISPQLASEIGLTAGDLGLLTSLYFIVFAAFQLPLGVILDRYGPRRVQAVLIVIAGIGAALFAVGDDFAVLALGRGLIGLGVSGCLMAALQANVIWWPRDRLALVNGVTGAFGSIGALVSTVPVELLVQMVGWRGVFVVLAGLSVATAVLVWFAVPERREATERRGGGWRGQLRDLAEVYGDAFFWRICVVVLISGGVFLSYQSLWTASWLRDVAGLDRIGVANSLLMFNLGMLIGVLTIGFAADRLQTIGVQPIACLGAGVLLSILTQVLFALELTAFPAVLCFAYGYFGSSMLLVYTVLGQSFPQRLIGRVNTAQNMMVFIATFAAQWGIGEIIDLWPQIGEGRYDPEAQQTAMVVMIGLQLAGFAWFAWPRWSARSGREA